MNNFNLEAFEGLMNKIKQLEQPHCRFICTKETENQFEPYREEFLKMGCEIIGTNMLDGISEDKLFGYLVPIEREVKVIMKYGKTTS